MLIFNQQGFLAPAQPALTNLAEIRKVFVEDIPSQRRVELFESYLMYIEDLCVLIGGRFSQWLDGSFVTKSPEPQDIDLVNFVPYEVVESLGNTVSGFKFPESLAKYRVDAYFVSVYETSHRYYSHFKGNEAYWRSQFERTRPNRSGKNFKKGFLEISL